MPWWSAAIRNVGLLGSLLSQRLDSGTAATAAPYSRIYLPLLGAPPSPLVEQVRDLSGRKANSTALSLLLGGSRCILYPKSHPSVSSLDTIF